MAAAKWRQQMARLARIALTALFAWRWGDALRHRMASFALRCVISGVNAHILAAWSCGA